MNRDIVVSTDTPLVTNITTTKPAASGPFGAGDEVDVTVWFTEPVEALTNVTNAPRLRYECHKNLASNKIRAFRACLD